MPTFSSDLQKLDELLKSKAKLLAMVAPSFIIDFDFPEIVLKLRKLGFQKVVEITFGARMVNYEYEKILRENPGQRFISTSCATLVPFILNKYPELKKHLLPVVSPMIAQARIMKKYFPEYQNVFIGPCLTKKIEARQFPTEISLALTFKELREYLLTHPVATYSKLNQPNDSQFDSFSYAETEIYPLSGGTSQSMPITKTLSNNEYLIVDGIDKINHILQNFQSETQIRFYDLLACSGGCISGPGILNPESLEKRCQKVLQYQKLLQRNENSQKKGKVEDTEGIDFHRNF